MISMETPTLQTMRKLLRDQFTKENIDSPDTDAGLLLMHFLGLTKAQLLTEDLPLSEEELALLKEPIRRRLCGEPVHYILGRCPFLDLSIRVNSSTLIPRPETELLVEAILERYPKDSRLTLWDIGCGSGCIGLSLAHARPNWQVVELDISAAALATARATAEDYHLTDRITFLEHNILEGMPTITPPQIIVSNPPYITTAAMKDLQREVRDFEPHTALHGGTDGLDFYRAILANAPLAKDGLLAFEIGYDQGEAVSSMMEKCGYREVTLKKDYAGLDRMVLGYHN